VAPTLAGPSPSPDTSKKDDWLGTVKTVAGVVAVVVTVAGGVYLVYKATEYLPPPKKR
jgi:imidazole glycerol phosphate synthase subunit HisF